MKVKMSVTALLLLSFCLPVLGQTIVTSAKPGVEEKKAASELQMHLQKAMHRKISILPEGQGGGTGPRLYVGNTAFAQKQGFSCSQFNAEEWRLKSVGEDLILLGGAPQGTLYAVFEFLEQQVQVMWLDKQTTVIPPLKTWPRNIDLRGKPSFRIRSLYTHFPDDKRPLQTFFIRNRQNLFGDTDSTPFLRSWNLYPVFGAPRSCHTYYNYTCEWGKSEENCFSMDAKGKRIRNTSAYGPGQLCFTNPRTVELVVQKMKQYIKGDQDRYGKNHTPLVYELSANDNINYCRCPGCTAAAKKYGSYAGVVLEFTNAVARRIRPEYPQVMIEMFAYTFAEEAPKGIRAEPNVLIRIAQLGTEYSGVRDTLRSIFHPNNAEPLKRMNSWRSLGALAIWDYWIMYHRYPEISLCTQAIDDNLKFYKKEGVQSVFVEVENPMTNIFYPLRLWAGLQHMNNADLDMEQTVARFMKGYYQEGAGPMTELYHYIIRRNNEVKEKLNDVLPNRRRDLDDEFFDTAYRLIDKALNLVWTPEASQHIRKERIVLDMVRIYNMDRLKPMDFRPLVERTRADIAEISPVWNNKENTEIARNDFEVFAGRALQKEVPLPAQFAGRKPAIDLTWGKLNIYQTTRLWDDPEAAGGKAIAQPEKGQSGGRITFGFYDFTSQQKRFDFEIKADKVPRDERYHFYHVGRVTLTKNCMLWAHPSWCLHRRLEEFYSEKGSNEYDLYVSLKAQGPAFVNGSKKPGALMMDRILLFR